jgi:hypothetical protein
VEEKSLLSITVVKHTRSHPLSEEGQSLLEFLLLFPVMIGLLAVFVRMSSAIQVSINNQQYARQHTLFKAFNSPYYPSRKFAAVLAEDKSNRFVVGVSDQPIDPSDEESRQAVATTQMVSRTKAMSGGPGPTQEEPDRRGIVRVRTTVALCTHPITIQGAKGPVPFKGGNLAEGTKIDFCNSNKKEHSPL